MIKVRVKALFSVLTVVACLVLNQAVSGHQQEHWQKDWQTFGEAIADFAVLGVVERHGDVIGFNRIFSKEVEWSGKLKGFHSNPVAKFITLAMKPIHIPLSDGSTVEVSELSISCAVEKSGCEGWSAKLSGEEVVFRTKLTNRTKGVLPVVRVLNMSKEDRRISIETYGAELVRVVTK